MMPSVTLNAPPYVPTSSPIRKTVGSRSISSQIPARIASTIVAVPPRGRRSSLRSFLIAVDIFQESVAVRYLHRSLGRWQTQFIRDARYQFLQFAQVLSTGINEGPIDAAVRR